MTDHDKLVEACKAGNCAIAIGILAAKYRWGNYCCFLNRSIATLSEMMCEYWAMEMSPRSVKA